MIPLRTRFRQSPATVAMMKKITAKTDAVGLFPLNTITAEVRGGQLVVFSLALPFPKITWAIVRLSHRTLSPTRRDLRALAAGHRCGTSRLRAEECAESACRVDACPLQSKLRKQCRVNF